MESAMDRQHAELKARQRAERESHPESIALRIHRALSWLDRAEQCDDADARFIFLWIAFNAAYANDLGDLGHIAEQRVLQNFIQRLVDLDKEDALYDLVWNEFTSSIRILLDNQYVFGPFWEFQRGKLTEEQWSNRFSKARVAVNRALANHDTVKVLSIVFSRLYILRNQLVHGSATWNSSVNREQLRDSANILGKVVPQVIKILLDHPNEVWGDALYPVVS
jgi:hypothetical protein